MDRHGAEVVSPGASSSAPRRGNQSRFGGTGYRLGDTEDAPTDVVMGAPVRQATREVCSFKIEFGYLQISNQY